MAWKAEYREVRHNTCLLTIKTLYKIYYKIAKIMAEKRKNGGFGGFKWHFLLSLSFSYMVYFPIFYILTLFPFVQGLIINTVDKLNEKSF